MNSHQLRIALFIFLCASTTLVAQKTDSTIVRNPVLGKNHQAIPGTRLAWIPPKGFHRKPGGMDVFVDTTLQASLMLMGSDNPFSVDQFRQMIAVNVKDSESVSTTTIRLNDLDAFLMESHDTTDQAGYGRFVFCVGDKIGTTAFMVVLPWAASAEKTTAMKEALLSFVLQKAK